MKSMFKDALILFLITLVAGLALGYVYFITKEPIAKADAAAKEAAYKEVYKDASSFEHIDSFENMVNDSEWNNSGFSKVDVNDAFLAKDSNGDVLGYVLMITTKEGFGGDIVFSMGIQKDGTMNGISILSISETAGLGMKADPVLKPQFSGKKVPSFTVTKLGSTSDSEIDAISGATITSNALTNGVNAGLYFYQTALGGGRYEG